MKKLTRLATILTGRTGRVILIALTIALFVLAAGAPNATVGIGK